MSGEDKSALAAALQAAQDDDSAEGSLTWGQFRHLLYSPLRRPWLVVLPWLAVFVASAVVLMVIPKKYRSTTLILAEQEKMPDKFVPKVATEEYSRRLDNIRPEILSRTRLESVIASTNPYPEVDSQTRAVDLMRVNTAVNLSGSDGFTIEFIHKDPRKAQEVTDRLATLFITEAMKDREQQVEDAVDFLVTQVADARRELEKKEAALRAFKESRMGRLPEQMQANLATLEMLQREMQTVEESLFLARDKRDALARGTTRSIGAAAPASPNDLVLMRNDLAALRNRYTDQHPDVESLRARIARTEAALAARGERLDAAPVDTAAITREQLQVASDEVKKLTERQADLERRIQTIRGHVEETPRTEQELANLTRDYQKLSDNYTALLTKQLDAQMAGRLEHRWKGDRFRVLDPAHLPEKPDSPKPVRILGLGMVVGMLVGLGAALSAELLDPTVKDVEQLQTMLPIPVLARIPHLRAVSPAHKLL